MAKFGKMLLSTTKEIFAFKSEEPSNNAKYQYPVIRNVGKDVKVKKLKK